MQCMNKVKFGDHQKFQSHVLTDLHISSVCKLNIGHKNKGSNMNHIEILKKSLYPPY